MRRVDQVFSQIRVERLKRNKIVVVSVPYVRTTSILWPQCCREIRMRLNCPKLRSPLALLTTLSSLSLYNITNKMLNWAAFGPFILLSVLLRKRRGHDPGVWWVFKHSRVKNNPPATQTISFSACDVRNFSLLSFRLVTQSEILPVESKSFSVNTRYFQSHRVEYHINKKFDVCWPSNLFRRQNV